MGTCAQARRGLLFPRLSSQFLSPLHEVQSMKNHVLRPLLVVIGLVIILLVFRYFYVPQDFGIQRNGFTYGLYRTGAIEDWKKVTVKYQGNESCKACHQDVFDKMASYPHVIIQCENCHGPALKHPRSPCLLYTSDAADDLLCVDL